MAQDQAHSNPTILSKTIKGFILAGIIQMIIKISWISECIRPKG